MMLTGGIGLIFAPAERGGVQICAASICAAPLSASPAFCETKGRASASHSSQTLEQRRDQFHLARLGEFLHPAQSARERLPSTNARRLFSSRPATRPAANQMALQALDNLRQQQALSLAYFDVFVGAMIVSVAMIVLVPFMKRSVAEKGEHVAAD